MELINKKKTVRRKKIDQGFDYLIKEAKRLDIYHSVFNIYGYKGREQKAKLEIIDNPEVVITVDFNRNKMSWIERVNLKKEKELKERMGLHNKRVNAEYKTTNN